ncbi:MAG: hypothetical protein HY879_04535 [Deltaproteobacteria bacterium]|nr:hypothetical protein [Deltaproteobacteria bacterium]
MSRKIPKAVHDMLKTVGKKATQAGIGKWWGWGEGQRWRIRPRILENDMSWERKRGVAENRDIFRED